MSNTGPAGRQELANAMLIAMVMNVETGSGGREISQRLIARTNDVSRTSSRVVLTARRWVSSSRGSLNDPGDDGGAMPGSPRESAEQPFKPLHGECWIPQMAFLALCSGVSRREIASVVTMTRAGPGAT